MKAQAVEFPCRHRPMFMYKTLRARVRIENIGILLFIYFVAYESKPQLCF